MLLVYLIVESSHVVLLWHGSMFFCLWHLSSCFACIGNSPLTQLYHQQFHGTNSDGAAAYTLIQNTGSGRNTWRFGNTAVSGIFGVGNFSLSALLARLKAFQLPWIADLYSIGLSLWRCISKITILSLWLSWYFVGTSMFIGTTVSLVAILHCHGWETSEKQHLPQKGNLQEVSLHLELLRTSNDCVRLLSEVLCLRECADNKGRHLTDTIFRKWIL